MIVFFDFDDVLFHTNQFRKDLKGVFKEQGITEEFFVQSYIAIKKSFSGGKMRTYDFDRHVKELHGYTSFDEKKLRDSVDVFLRGSGKYLFSDSLLIIKDIKNRGDRVAIVSYGTASFQEKKVQSSGIEKFVDESMVGDIHKGKAIRTYLENERDGGRNSWFIEDREEHIRNVKEENPHIQTILLTRSEGRYGDSMSRYCDFEAKNMKEVKDIIIR